MGEVIHGYGRFAKSTQPPDNGDMEARIAKLEASVEHIQRDITGIQSDVKDLRGDNKDLQTQITGIRTTDFRILFGAIIAVALGLAGLMAKGFHWF